MPKFDSLTVELLRQKINAQRKGLAPDDVQSRSHLACDRLVKFAQNNWKPSDFAQKVIGMYSPFHGEINPASLMRASIFSQSYFAYPRIKSLADGTMDFAIVSHESDWVKGRLGILEPRKELPSVAQDQFALFVIPGLVFGTHGERVGMGAGFYDRFLSQYPKVLRVALAYDFQIQDEPFTQNAWDIKMDGIFTESKEFLVNL